MPDLSIVVPAFNEAERLPGTLEAIDAWVTSETEGWVQVVVVDDGSRDGTAAVAERWAAIRSAPGPAVVIRAEHRGKGAAVARGMQAASGRVRMFMDADLAVPLAYVSDLLAALAQGSDVAVASREAKGARRWDEPSYRHWLGRAFNAVVGVVAGVRLKDTQCGFKAFRAAAAERVFDRVRLYPVDGDILTAPRVTAFDVELLTIARRQDLQVVEVGVQWRHVPGSKVRPLADSLSMLGDAVRVRWNDWRGRYS